ncbi:hypothetical protein [Alkalihalobacterium sp. APHAB7]|uniref:hypothetical protein n=1 Tax=Alkalihalobacterium sp. APHAB7 TaxID=3402081 RepID=UPI003AAF96F4
MVFLFPSWLFIVLGVFLVAILCGLFSFFVSKWLKKKEVKDKRFENIAAFVIVIIVIASAWFVKENMFVTAFEGSMIVTEEKEVEVNYSSAEFLAFSDFIIIDYLFTQMNYGEEFEIGNDEDGNVRVAVVINDHKPLLQYMKTYEDEDFQRFAKHYFPFDLYFEREHASIINDIIQQQDQNNSCEQLLPSLEQELQKKEEQYFEYEVACTIERG